MIRAITREEIRLKLFQNEHVALIEVGPSIAFDEAHIAKAIHLPGEIFDSPESFAKWTRAYFSAGGGKGKEIVLYTQGDDSRAELAAQQLNEMGYADLFLYRAGKADWIQASLPTESVH